MTNSNHRTTSLVTGLLSRDSTSEPSPLEESGLEQMSDDEIRRAALLKIAEIKRKQAQRTEDVIRRAFLRKLAEIKRKQNRRRANNSIEEGHSASEM
jgi:hypothetical protein